MEAKQYRMEHATASSSPFFLDAIYKLPLHSIVINLKEKVEVRIIKRKEPPISTTTSVESSIYITGRDVCLIETR